MANPLLLARQAGVLPPLRQATATNHGPYLISASYTFVILMIIVVLSRLISRYLVMEPSLDDLFIFLAAIVAIVQSILVQFAADHGLGKHEQSLSETEFQQFSKFNYAAQLLFIVVLVLSRLSVSALIGSLKADRKHLLANRFCAGLIIAWGAIALLSLGFQCKLPYPWASSPHSTCVNRPALYTEIDVTGMLTDLSLVIVPFLIMRDVQFTTAKRVTVNSLFALRFMVIIVTAVKLGFSQEYFTNISSKSHGSIAKDGTWTLLVPTIWRQAEMMLSIICSCLPSLKRLLVNMGPGLNGVTIPLALEHSLSTAYEQDCVRANFDSRNRSVYFDSPNNRRHSNTELTGTNSSSEQTSGTQSTLVPGTNRTKITAGKKVAMRASERELEALERESEFLYGPTMLRNLDSVRLREAGVFRTEISVTHEPMHRRESSSINSDPSMKAMTRSSHHMI